MGVGIRVRGVSVWVMMRVRDNGGLKERLPPGVRHRPLQWDLTQGVRRGG